MTQEEFDKRWLEESEKWAQTFTVASLTIPGSQCDERARAITIPGNGVWVIMHNLLNRMGLSHAQTTFKKVIKEYTNSKTGLTIQLRGKLPTAIRAFGRGENSSMAHTSCNHLCISIDSLLKLIEVVQDDKVKMGRMVKKSRPSFESIDKFCDWLVGEAIPFFEKTEGVNIEECSKKVPAPSKPVEPFEEVADEQPKPTWLSHRSKEAEKVEAEDDKAELIRDRMIRLITEKFGTYKGEEFCEADNPSEQADFEAFVRAMQVRFFQHGRNNEFPPEWQTLARQVDPNYQIFMEIYGG